MIDLAKSLNIKIFFEKKIPDSIMLRVFSDISKCKKYKQIYNKIKSLSYLTHKQKLALLHFFAGYKRSDQRIMVGCEIDKFIKESINFLPFTEEQKVEIEYEFSEINKERFRDT